MRVAGIYRKSRCADMGKTMTDYPDYCSIHNVQMRCVPWENGKSIWECKECRKEQHAWISEAFKDFKPGRDPRSSEVEDLREEIKESRELLREELSAKIAQHVNKLNMTKVDPK